MGMRSFGALCDSVEAYTNNATAGAALPIVQAGYDRALQGRDPRSGVCHSWSFLEPVADLSIALNITGTATGTYDAGTDLTTITATTDIFTPSQVGETITCTGGGLGAPILLTVASYTSSKIIVCDAGSAFAGAAVSLPHTGLYALPSDFGGLIEAPVYPWPDGESVAAFEEVSPEEIFADWRASNTRGIAEKFALVPVAQPAAQTAQQWAIIVSPRPEATRILRYRYSVIPAAAVDSAAAYPVGHAAMNTVYESAALAEAEIRASGAAGRWEQRYQESMAAAIDVDESRFKTDGPAQMESE